MPMLRLSLLLVAFLAAAPAARRAVPKPAPAPVRPKPTAAPAAGDARITAVEPLDLLYLARDKRATLTCAQVTEGAAEALFDGNGTTSARVAAAGAAWAQVVFSAPRVITEVAPVFPESARWSLLAADSEADLRARTGSFHTLVPLRVAASGREEPVALTGGRPYRVYRLEFRRATGEGDVAISEWGMQGPQQIAWLTLEPFATTVVRGDLLQLRAVATFEGGGHQNVTPAAAWELSPAGAARVDKEGHLEALSTGQAQLTARYGGVRSIPQPLDLLSNGKPDLDVTHIERQPRGPAARAGSSVTWYAHVANYGTAEAPQTPVEWRVDGQTVRSGMLPKVARFAHTEVVLTLPDDGQAHTLELVVDPNGTANEESVANNRLLVPTDARSLGFWVESSFHRYFHQRQRDLGVGSNSFEDWAQRQVRLWNEWAARDGGMLTPPQAPPRLRLDEIRVVGDGMLPLAGGVAEREPDRRDRSVELQAGFPARQVAQDTLYRNTAARTESNPFYVHAELLKQLIRASGAAGANR